jgi:hypothetical protein
MIASFSTNVRDFSELIAALLEIGVGFPTFRGNSYSLPLG